MDSGSQVQVKPEIAEILIEPDLSLEDLEDFEDSNEAAESYDEQPSTSYDNYEPLPLFVDIKVEPDFIRPFKCPLCDKTFLKANNRDRHVKYMHPKPEDQTQCLLCSKLFKSKFHLKVHTDNVHVKEDPATCDICQKVYSSPKKLRNHYFFAHPKEEVAFCHLCSKFFRSKYILKLHSKQVHPPEADRVECHDCGKEFKNKLLLTKHIKWKHPNDNKIYKCLICNQILSTLLSYKLHHHNVHKGSEIALACFICRKPYKNFRTVKKHLRHGHSTEIRLSGLTMKEQMELCKETAQEMGPNKPEPLEFNDLNEILCNLCDKGFDCKRKLLNHKRITHAPPEAAQICILCHKTFKTALHLNIHIKSVHDSIPHICDICHKEFKARKYLLKHKATHSVIRYECDVCAKSYKSKDELRKHMKKFHIIEENWSMNNFCEINYVPLKQHKHNREEELGEYSQINESGEPPKTTRFICPTCEKSFASKQSLTDHKRIVHAPPEAAQSCDICQKSFKSMHHLKIHQKSLHDSNKHICEYCQKTFKSRNYLMKHRRTHIDTKFSCHLCPRFYKCKDNLTKHMKRIHFTEAVKEEKQEMNSDWNEVQLNANSENSFETIKETNNLDTNDKGVGLRGELNEATVNLDNIKRENIELDGNCTVNKDLVNNENESSMIETGNNFTIADSLKSKFNQIRSMIFDKVYCKKCYELFDNHSALEQHVRRCLFTKCSQCNGVYENQRELLRHMPYCTYRCDDGTVEVEIERLDEESLATA